MVCFRVASWGDANTQLRGSIHSHIWSFSKMFCVSERYVNRTPYVNPAETTRRGNRGTKTCAALELWDPDQRTELEDKLEMPSSEEMLWKMTQQLQTAFVITGGHVWGQVCVAVRGWKTQCSHQLPSDWSVGWSPSQKPGRTTCKMTSISS